MNLQQFQSKFGTHEACRDHLESLRWPQGPVCPMCGSINEARRITPRPDILRCKCKAEFRVTDGMPLEGSYLDLNTWFLGHRVREMLASGAAQKLTGVVEAAETYVGGKKPKGRDDDEDEDEGGTPSHRGRDKARATVLVAVERGGGVKAERIASHGTADIALSLYRWVDLPSTILMTDELPAYRWIGRRMRRHMAVRHASGQYATTDAESGLRVHNNTAESFNCQLKRAIIGVWHYVSAKHVSRYAGEVGFRWNHRADSILGRLDAALAGGFRLPWRKHTA